MKKQRAENMLEGCFPRCSTFAALSLKRLYISKKIVLAIVAGLVVLVIGGFFLLVFAGFILNPIVPTDVQIARAIEENQDLLENIDGVLAAGFGTNVHIDGINIYIDADMTNTQGVPAQLGEFPVFLIRIDNSQPHDGEGFLWCSPDLNLKPEESPEAT